MPIDLPQILDVSDLRRVAIVEALAERQWRRDARLGVHVPAWRKAQIHAVQRKDVEAAGQDPIRAPDIRRRVEVARQLGDPRLAARSRRIGRRARQAQPSPLRSALNLAPHTEADFGRGHGPETIESPEQRHPRHNERARPRFR